MKKQGADVIGAKAGAKPKKPYIQKDTIGSTQNAEIVYGIGDGENGGLINGLNSIILDGTRVIGSSGEVNFNEVKYEERFGLIDQPPLKLIEDTVTERGLNLEVRSAAPVVSSFNNKDVDKFVVRISVPSLMQNKDNGDSVAASISYAIDISVDGGAYQTVVEASATEKITNGYEFEHEIEAPEGTQRTIRVRRTTPDSTSQLLIDKFYVAAISEVINAKFSHPTLHHIGLVFNAEQFNNIPKVVFNYYGRKIKVPVNYNPTTRQYDGIWNGTFKVVYSNNPAWVLFDILTDRRSGLGRRIPIELVDKWELYRIAQYCDELVPDGDGGMEPRFVCNNLVLNSKQDAYQVLKDIASIFRGQSFWNGSQVVTVADAPRDIDYAISMASVISYSYSGTARNARHNVVKVQYYDKNNDNSAAYEYATDYDSIRETEQINEVEIRAFGCTSAGQAQRLARYTLLSEQTETRILTAKLSMDAFVNMQIGDVFAWSDKFLAGANNGGRVVAVNGAVLTLDRDVTESALVGDTLFVNTTSGKASTRTITAINGNKVTLDDVMPTTEPEFVWVIDSAELSLLYFKLDDYKVNPAEGTVDIVGIQHVNGKFGTIDSETALEAPPFSKVEIETLRAPGNVITSFNVRVDQGINIADLYVSWGQVKGATRYTVEFRRDSQAWRVLGNVTGLTHTIENVSAGIYEVRVRAADSIGNLSPYGFSAPINVAGIVLPPPKLASFTAVGKLLAIETKWAFPAGTEASLAVVIEHANQDPANVGVPTQKVNIPYPQSSYTFTSLGAHAKMWFRAAIVDKYGQEGEYTAWVTATADADPEELIDLISGHISEGTLDQTLKGKIDGAGALAGEAQTLANQAKTAAANAQTTANNAGTAAADAAGKATAAANAVAKEVTDRVAAVTAETNARTAAISKEATDRAAALTAQATTLKADSAAKVKALKDEVDPKITTLQNGITQVTTDYKAADTAVVGQLNAYKTSNDSAVASVLQKAESAVSTGSTNSSAITAINGQITALNGALSTKLDASVISGYYTKGQTDAKAAEIAAGKVEEFNANLVIGGTNLYSGTTDAWQEVTFGGWQSYLHDLVISPNATLNEGDVITWSGDVLDELNNASLMLHFVVPSNPLGYIQRHSSGANAGEKATVKGTTAVPVGATAVRMALRHDNGSAPSSAFKFRRLQIEKGSRVTGWAPSPQDTQAALDANSTAIQNTNAEVTRVDGVATAANNATTALAGRMSTVEGAVATKAEAAALTALTTRVTNAEGVNTSQGSAITTLQNTINHATTGLATKASSSALTATNSEVSRVNGVVTGHANQLTQLASDITAINGTLATKANASALNDIYTKTQADANATSIAAGEVAKYDASLVIGGDNLAANSDKALWSAYYSSVLVQAEGIVNSTLKTKKAIRVSSTGGTDSIKAVRTFSGLELSANIVMSVKVQNTGTNPIVVRCNGIDNLKKDPASITLNAGEFKFIEWVGVTRSAYDFIQIIVNSNVVSNAISFEASDIKVEYGTKATAWTPSSKDTQAALDANATAITNTNTEVARVDGRVTTESNRVTTLTGRVSTVENGLALKADASALSSLTTRVETEEGKSTSQGSAITSLQNTVNHATTGLATKASSSALTAVDNKVIAVDGRVTATNSNVATLSGRVSTVEGNLATKADVSALNNIYTKTESDAKATSLAAGEISKYDASLVIGGTNLFSFADSVAGYVSGSGSITNGAATHQSMTALIPLGRHTDMTYQVWNPAAIRNTSNTNRIAFFKADGSFLSATALPQLNGTTYQTTLIQIPAAATHARLGVIVGTANGGRDDAVKVKIEFGNKATDWSEADSAIVDSLNVNATAISTTNTEVSRINGVVAGHTTQLSNLTASIAGKADTTALNALTVRVATEEGKSSSQATSITNLSASLSDLSAGGRNYVKDGTAVNSNLYLTVPIKELVAKSIAQGKPICLSFDLELTQAALAGSKNRIGYELSYVDSSGATRWLGLWATPTTNYAVGLHRVKVKYTPPYPTESTATYIGFYNQTGSGVGISAKNLMIEIGDIHSDYTTAPEDTPDLSGYATTSALNTLTTEVNRVNGVVVGHATQLTNLNAAIAGKADAAALSSLTTRVAAEEGKSTSQGTAITNLENTVNNATTGLASKASSQALTTLNNQVQHSTTGLSAVNSKVDNLKATVENTTNGLATKADASALTNIYTKVQTDSAISGAISTYKATVDTALGSKLNASVITNYYTSAQTDSKIESIAAGKIEQFTSSSLPAVIETAISGLDSLAIPDTRNDNQPPSWYWSNYPKKSVTEFKRGTAVGSPGGNTGYGTLTTVVPWNDGSGSPIRQIFETGDGINIATRYSTGVDTWSTWRTELKSLSTTVSTVTETVDGVKGVHALKIDNNGVIAGYGLISELVNGTVKSQFGINANTFFIGAPSSNKKPFVVLTTTGTINGVTGVPAGTYIDSAYIANSTITTAKINNLAVTTAKIDNLAVTTAKIGNLQVDTLKIKDNAVTVPVGVRYNTVLITTDAVRNAMNTYAGQQGWRNPTTGAWSFPTTLQGSITVWEAGTPALFNITVPRAGGKCRLDLSLSTSIDRGTNAPTFVGVGPGNQPESVMRDARMFISIYRGSTLIGRTSMSPTTFSGSTAGFTGNVSLMALDDTAMTGNTVYTGKISFGYIGSISNSITVTTAFGTLAIEQMTVSALEIKK